MIVIFFLCVGKSEIPLYLIGTFTTRASWLRRAINCVRSWTKSRYVQVSCDLDLTPAKSYGRQEDCGRFGWGTKNSKNRGHFLERHISLCALFFRAIRSVVFNWDGNESSMAFNVSHGNYRSVETYRVLAGEIKSGYRTNIIEILWFAMKIVNRYRQVSQRVIWKLSPLQQRELCQ